MYSIKFIRDNTELVQNSILKKNSDIDLNEILDLDFKRRTLIQEVETLKMDKNSYTTILDGKNIYLPKKEFDLLFFLMKNSSKVYSRDSLLRNVWGSGIHVVARTVDVHVRKLREKIGVNFIKTIKGVGYKFEVLTKN